MNPWQGLKVPAFEVLRTKRAEPAPNSPLACEGGRGLRGRVSAASGRWAKPPSAGDFQAPATRREGKITPRRTRRWQGGRRWRGYGAERSE